MKAMNKKYVKIGVAGLAVAALVIGLSVGLTQRNKANRNAAASNAEGMDMGGYDMEMDVTCSSTSGKSGKSGGSSGKSGKSGASGSSSSSDDASVDASRRHLVVPGTEDYAVRAEEANRRKLNKIRKLSTALVRELKSDMPEEMSREEESEEETDGSGVSSSSSGKSGKSGGTSSCGKSGKSGGSSGKSGKSGNMSYSTSSDGDDDEDDCPPSIDDKCIKPKDSCPTSTSSGTSSSGKSGKSGGSSGKSGKSGGTSSSMLYSTSSGKSGKSGGSSSCGKSGKSGREGKSGKSGNMSYSTSSDGDGDEDCPTKVTFCSSSSSGKSGKSGGSSSCGKSGKSGGSYSSSCSTSEDEDDCTPRPPTVCGLSCEESKWTIDDGGECVKLVGVCGANDNETSTCFETAEECCKKAEYEEKCVEVEDDHGFTCEVKEITCEDSDWTIVGEQCVKLLGICDSADNVTSSCFNTAKKCCEEAGYVGGCVEVEDDNGLVCVVREPNCADQKKWFLMEGEVCVKDVNECNDGEGSDEGCFNNEQQCCKELTGKPNVCKEVDECRVVPLTCADQKKWFLDGDKCVKNVKKCNDGEGSDEGCFNNEQQCCKKLTGDTQGCVEVDDCLVEPNSATVIDTPPPTVFPPTTSPPTPAATNLGTETVGASQQSKVEVMPPRDGH